MKAIVACLVLVAAVAIVLGADCPTYNVKCAKKDAACNLNYNTGSNAYTAVTCSDNQICGISNGTQTDYTGTCYSGKTAGQSCGTATSACADGLYCDGSKCVAITYNVGAGGACNSNTLSKTKICSVNMYCNATLTTEGICQAKSAVGADCGLAGCVLGATCSKAGKCISLFSVAAGGDCATTGTQECVGGAYCSTDGKCVIAAKDSKADCTSSKTCSDANEVCSAYCKSAGASFSYMCFQKNSADYSTSQASALKDFQSCQVSNNEVCIDDSSCKKCFDDQCKADDEDSVGFTPDVPTCGNTVCSSSTSIAVSAILLVAALFVAM